MPSITLQTIAAQATTSRGKGLIEAVGLGTGRGAVAFGSGRQDMPRVGAWFGLVSGVVHEWLGVDDAAEPQNKRQAVWTPPLELMCGFASQAADAAPRERDRLVWVGVEVWPHGMHAVRSMAARRTLLGERSLYVEAQSAHERLWAADLALRSRTSAAVIIDGRGFDLTATRRLQLVAESSGCVVMLARPSWERQQLSAAALRWLVCWDASQAGKRRWTLELLRHKGGASLVGTHRWVVERDHERDCKAGAWRVAADLGERSGATGDGAPRLRRLG